MMEDLEDVLNRLNEVEKKINSIRLGIYGDAENEVPGLLQTVRVLKSIINECKKDIQIIKNERKRERLKIVYFGLGMGAVISAIIWVIELWVNSKR